MYQLLEFQTVDASHFYHNSDDKDKGRRKSEILQELISQIMANSQPVLSAQLKSMITPDLRHYIVTVTVLVKINCTFSENSIIFLSNKFLRTH